MAGKYAELPLRIASAAVLAAFALLCTWIGGKTFTLLAIALALLIFFEFRAMVRSHLPSRFAFAAFGFLLLVFGFYLVNQQISGLIILGVGTGVLLLWEWIVQRRIWGAVLLVYAAVPFAALVDMREGDSGFFIILFVFACVWGADTFAYFSGKTFGGPKLAPRHFTKQDLVRFYRRHCWSHCHFSPVGDRFWLPGQHAGCAFGGSSGLVFPDWRPV